MLDIKLIREEPQLVKESLEKRHMDSSPVDLAISLDEKRRELIIKVEEMRSERNAVSKEIGRMKDKDSRQAKIDAMRELGEKIDGVDAELQNVESDLTELLLTIPNIPDPEVPVGVDDRDNIVLRTVGEIPQFNFEPKPVSYTHLTLPTN